MSLKYFIEKLEDVAEVSRPLYKKSGEGFVLDVTGVVSDEEHEVLNNKLAEFRDNNRKLNAQVNEFTTKFKDIDPDKVRQVLTENEELKKKIPHGPGGESMEVLIAKAVEAATTPINKKLEQTEQKEREASERLRRKLTEDKLWEHGLKAGVREEARGFWIGEAAKVFRLDGDELVGVRLDSEGKEQPLYSKRKGGAGATLTPEEWSLEWAPKDPALSILYKGSTGSGAKNETGETRRDGVRVISNDPALTSQNIEGIASGKVLVNSGAR